MFETPGRAGVLDRFWSGVSRRLALVGVGLMLAFVVFVGGASVASAATDASPVFMADTPPAFQLDVVYGPANSCGSGCAYNDQVGYAFVASGNPVPTYSGTRPRSRS